ncbi:MAG TPA: MBL fold metallo-hydrolase, partial [Methanoregula sp.]|nr:MBL fold metallo-hydrolase [Methanoregula sp.]
VQLDFELADGDVIDPDGTEEYEIQVFHTPGHSAGSVSLLLPAEGALFCGDAVPVDGDLPVYEDPIQSLQSIKKLTAVRGVRFLLSSWDIPREGKAAYEQMERGRSCLQKIHTATIAASADGCTDPMEVATRVAVLLGFPPQAVMPLLARTLAAHIRLKGCPVLDDSC